MKSSLDLTPSGLCGPEKCLSSKKWYPMKSNLCVETSSNFLVFTTRKPRVRTMVRFLVLDRASVWEGTLISQSSRYWCSHMSCFRAIRLTFFTSEVKIKMAVARPKGRLVNWYEASWIWNLRNFLDCGCIGRLR